MTFDASEARVKIQARDDCDLIYKKPTQSHFEKYPF